MNLGMGVMIKLLGGNAESAAALQECIGHTISELAQIKDGDGGLIFKFGNGAVLQVSDEGRSCCEARYIICDDKLQEFVGSELLGMEIKAGPTSEDDEYGGRHEIQFLDIHTSKGVFQCATHNEHNGYYGGFAVECKLLVAPPEPVVNAIKQEQGKQ